MHVQMNTFARVNLKSFVKNVLKMLVSAIDLQDARAFFTILFFDFSS